MKKETKKEATLDELWEVSDDYVSVSNEDLATNLKAKFKKNPNCLYIENKDISNLLAIDKSAYEDYATSQYGGNFTMRNNTTATVAGDYVIFERFKDYRGIKIYELNCNSDILLLENKKGNRYVFATSDTIVKGSNNTLIFTDEDDILIYDIEKDTFSEGE